MTQPVEKACADCGMALSDDETWVCSDCCAFYEMTDPNGYGDDDE
jgi:predicted nucleic acid-binding Zn ribbon protein